jgi:hypothetical protein
MLQRRRRTAHFQVEKLERRAVPSIIATSAVINLSNKRFAHIYGYTTSPTGAGETLEIAATEQRARGADRIVTRIDYTVVAPTPNHDHTGRFSAYVETANKYEHFYLDGNLTVFAVNITSRTDPHTVEQTETAHVHIRGD